MDRYSVTSVRQTRVLVLVLAFVLLSPLGAVQAEHGGDNGQSISGASPHPACNLLAIPAGINDAEIWPHLAVNPKDPNNIAVAWVQDWADGLVVGVSRDGGINWTQNIPPQNSWCSGEPRYNSSFDQHLSFGPDGRLYLSNHNIDGFTSFTRTTVHVSTDGGLSWSPPVTLEESGPVALSNVLDWSWVAADPSRPGTVYAAWYAYDWLAAENGKRLSGDFLRHRFSRSTDGGKTWLPPWEINHAPDGYFRGASMIVALPDGSLVNLFRQYPACERPCPPTTVHVMATRSTDQGDTWSEQVLVGVRENYCIEPVEDERVNNLGVPPGGLPAVSSEGTIYYAWSDMAPDSSSKLFLTSSSDGGLTWSAPEVIHASNGPMANAMVAVTPDGEVGVLFYDLRNDVPGDDVATTDVWFIRPSDNAEQHLAGPFDILSVPPNEFTREWLGSYYHIGTYQGIAGVPGGFVTAYTVAMPLSTVGATDIFFRRMDSHP